MAEEFTVALAGNPNSGKSTVFNSLTGGRQHVGNWPGKTVEKKEGTCRRDGYDIKLVDLPGTYSLTAYSLEEIIARDYIVNEHPDVVVDVVDASNLERNLYLAVQILELGANLVIALNMSDMAESRGYKIDVAKLSEGLGGIPVVPTVANRGWGIQELIDEVVQVAGSRPKGTTTSGEATAEAAGS
jgi:ferrous iron transport protein B